MICGNCKQEARRVKTVFEKNGQALPVPLDECEFCAENGYHEDPAWLRHKPVPLWESRPHLYKRKENPEGGWMYEPTDENLADLEAQICAPASDEVLAKQRAIEDKRNLPQKLEGAALAAAIAKANKMIAPAVEEWNRQVEENEQAWQEAAEDLRVQ